MGFIGDFLSKSVITGFIFGLAITIIIGQLPKILGVPSGGAGTLEQLAHLVGEIPNARNSTVSNKAVKASTSGYLKDILILQDLHFPARIR